MLSTFGADLKYDVNCLEFENLLTVMISEIIAIAVKTLIPCIEVKFNIKRSTGESH